MCTAMRGNNVAHGAVLPLFLGHLAYCYFHTGNGMQHTINNNICSHKYILKTIYNTKDMHIIIYNILS